jgi:predicted nucleic acid-binding Zn finger protein
MEDAQKSLFMGLNACHVLARSAPEFLQVLKGKWEQIHEALEGENVYRYVFNPSGISFWVVIGRTNEYLVIPPYYCTCGDFYFNALIKKKQICCYHVIVQLICQQNNQFVDILKNDDEYDEYIKDFLKDLK